MNLKNLIERTTCGLIAVVSVTLASAGGADPEIGRSVWSGVFSSESVERGEIVYAESCANCHGAEKRGGGGVPSLAGPEFRFNWNNRSLKDLFASMRSSMPPGQAGILTEQQYLDLLSSMLHSNGYPASDDGRSLSAEELGEITLLMNRS